MIHWEKMEMWKEGSWNEEDLGKFNQQRMTQQT